MTLWTSRLLPGFLLASLTFSSGGCSDGDKAEPQEVVAPTTEATPYPEDPDLAQGDKKDAAKAAGSNNPAPNESEAVGQLTTDTAPANPPPPADTATQEPATPLGDGDAVAGALEQHKPRYDAAPGRQAPKVPAYDGVKRGKGPKHTARDQGDSPASSGVKATRYVTATLLNVRKSASIKAPKVRQLTSGSEVLVEVHGKWAKIKKGEWVSTKYLSEAPVN